MFEFWERRAIKFESNKIDQCFLSLVDHFPYTPCPHTCSLPHYQHHSLERYIFFFFLPRMNLYWHHNHPKSIVDLRVYCRCCTHVVVCRGTPHPFMACLSSKGSLFSSGELFWHPHFDRSLKQGPQVNQSWFRKANMMSTWETGVLGGGSSNTVTFLKNLPTELVPLLKEISLYICFFCFHLSNSKYLPQRLLGAEKERTEACEAKP